MPAQGSHQKGVMSEYDGSNIGQIAPHPTRWELMLASPVKSWTVEDWSYAVIRTDDCLQSRAQALDLLRNAYPELASQVTSVLEAWEAGYGPGGPKLLGE